MPKLYLVTFIDADFDSGLPLLIVAESVEEAEQKFKSSGSMRFVYDFDVEEVNEVDGYKIMVAGKDC